MYHLRRVPRFCFCRCDGSRGSEEIVKACGARTLPTLQYWREGQFLWENEGSVVAQQELGEGMLFYGGRTQGGEKSEDWIAELANLDDLQEFVYSTDTLAVCNVSTKTSLGCIHIFPAFFALAKSMKGYVSFARLQPVGKENEEFQDCLDEFNIKDVPTFLFFYRGKLVHQHAGSSRGDLIGQILQVQQQVGGVMPPPPPRRR